MAKKASRNAMNPLPSLIRASAWDAGDRSMRAGGRKAWSRKDYNASVREQDRLIKSCYGRPDDSDERMAFIRFSVATEMQSHRMFDLQSDFDAILAQIDQIIAAPIAA